MIDNKEIRVLIAEDKRIVQLGLQEVINRAKGLKVVGIASNGKEAIEKVGQLQPDVIVLDLIMPIMDGFETAQIVSQDFNKTKILIVSGSSDEEQIIKAINVGANGYLKKETVKEDLVLAILTINRDNAYFSPEIMPIIHKSRWQKLDCQLSIERNLTKHRSIALPSKPLIESCKRAIAKEILLQWRLGQKISVTPQETIDYLEIENEAKLIKLLVDRSHNATQLEQYTVFDLLELIVIEISRTLAQNETYASEHLSIAKIQTEKWYFDFGLKELRVIAQELRFSIVDRFNKYINPHWLEASPEPLLEFFNELSKLFSEQQIKYETQKLAFIEKESNAWKAFFRLASLVDNRQKLVKKKQIWTSAFKALQVSFEYKFKSEIYSLLVQIILALIQSCQFYCDSLTKTNNLLKQTQYLDRTSFTSVGKFSFFIIGINKRTASIPNFCSR